MSNQILKHTLKAGAFATALTLSTLTMTQTAQACWFSWYCNETPVVTEPVAEPTPTPTYEAKNKLEDCPWSWTSWDYDSACRARVESAQRLATILQNYANKKASPPNEWTDGTWKDIFGIAYRPQNNLAERHHIIPISYNSFSNDSVGFNPKFVSHLRNDTQRPLLSQVIFTVPTPVSEGLAEQMREKLPTDPKTVDHMFHSIKTSSVNWAQHHYTSAEILMTMAWASSRANEWVTLLSAFGHPQITATNVSAKKKLTKQTLFTAMFNKAITFFNATPLALTPGVGVGIVESVGDDIETFAGLGANMFYILRAYLTPPIFSYVADPFKNPYYLDAVEYFTNMKDGVYDLLSSDLTLTAMQDYYNNINQQITQARADANMFMVGRLVGNVAYNVIGSFTPKGLLKSVANVAKKVTKITKKACKGKTCNKKGQGRRQRKARSCKSKRYIRDFKIFATNFGKEFSPKLQPQRNLNTANCSLLKAYKNGRAVPRGLVAIGKLDDDEVGIIPSSQPGSNAYKAWLLGTSRKSGKSRRYYRTVDSRCSHKSRGDSLTLMLKKVSKNRAGLKGYQASSDGHFLTR